MTSTPALLLNLDVFEVNARLVAATCARAGVRWRPHIKSLRSPELVRRLLDAGGRGVTCATIGEAEAMAGAGIGEILIANQVVSPDKISRLVALLATCDVIIAVDNLRNAQDLSLAAERAGRKVPVVVELDVGLGRAGVQPGANTLELVGAIVRLEGIDFRGLMAWEGHAAGDPDPARKRAKIHEAITKLVDSAQLCRRSGFEVEVVSCGGTGTFLVTAFLRGVTEVQVGAAVFADARTRLVLGLDHDPALTVLSTVTSRPSVTRIVCDAGRKSLSVDVMPPSPMIDASVVSLAFSAEHAVIELADSQRLPEIGDQIEFAVGYADQTVFLHERIYGTRHGRVVEVFPTSDLP